MTQSELGRVSEAIILNILSKSLADKKLSQVAFDGLRYKLKSEMEQRAALAEKIRVKLMPICICERCDNLEEGRLIQNVIELILEGN
jgi:hypothetical protein